MTQKAQALVLAEPDTGFRATLDTACQDAGYELVLEGSAEVATSKLSARRFDALILDMTTPGAALVCLKARGKLVRVRIPVIALVEAEDEVSFARAYRAGADEVLVADRGAALTARLRSLPKSGIPQPGTARGDAVVADADRARAEVIERVLRDAGFRVELAVDGFAARLQVGRPSLKVAVLDASLDDAPALIQQARTRGARCAWIVRGRPDSLEGLRTELAKLDRVAVVNAYGPPDDVLFETNRLLEPRESDGRADKRQLYGTIVRLKWDGQRDVDIGYTYNVSSVGLFIRTLAAPGSSTVELELLPPGMETLVKLKAEVIWRREFGTTRREPVPAGFGVKLTGGDLEVWGKACPRALSLPPQSLRPALIQIQSEPPQSALSTVRPDSPVDPGVPNTASPPAAKEAPSSPKAAPGPRRSSYTDKLRLPERLRGPIGGALAAISKPRKEPSPAPPAVVAKEEPGSPTPPKVVGGREPQSSVEEMLLSVLSGSGPGEDVLGAAPLSIDGGEVVELDKAGKQPSEEPPPPSVDPLPPPSVPRVEVRVAPEPVAPAPAAPVAAEPRKGDSEAPSIEIHRGLSAPPTRPERSSDGPTIEIASRPASELPRLPPPPPPVAAATVPAPAPGPSPMDRASRPSDSAELLEAEPLPSDPPQAPEGPLPTTSVGPMSLEVESKDLVPDELQKLATASKNQDTLGRNPDGSPKVSDPLAATVRAATSPFPPEALRGGSGPPPRSEIEDAVPAPRAAVSQVPPSASNINLEAEYEPPTNRSNRWLWLSIIGLGAGALSFFAVPFIRNLMAPAPALETSRTAAPPSPPLTAPAQSAAAEPVAPTSASAGPESPTAVAPSATAPAAAASASAPVAKAPSAPPASGDEPDQGALAALERGTGFLLVASSLQTNVYLYGILAGQTNQRLVSKCGPRFIRLGTAPGAWQSQGSVSVVKCGGFTRVQMNP